MSDAGPILYIAAFLRNVLQLRGMILATKGVSMTPSTKLSNRKSIPKILPLALEKILLLYTDADREKYLSISEIISHLRREFQIDVSDDSVRRTLSEMKNWYEIQVEQFEARCDERVTKNSDDQLDVPHQGEDNSGETGVINLFSLDITNHKGNEKRRFALRRSSDSEELAHGISHIVRQIRAHNPKEGEKDKSISDVERWVVSGLDLDTQKKILSKDTSASGSGHGNSQRLENILYNLTEISKAIERRNYITFSYMRGTASQSGTSAGKSEYLPLYIHFDGDHYYLAVKNRARSIMRKGRTGEIVFAPRILRVDRINNISHVSSDNPTDKKSYVVYPNVGKFEEMKANAQSLMEAGVGGVFSGKVIYARVKCHNKEKAVFVRDTFSGKANFEEITMTDAPHPEFRFCVSRDGFIRWARQWSDVIEVVEPKSVRKCIIKELSHNVYFCIDEG